MKNLGNAYLVLSRGTKRSRSKNVKKVSLEERCAIHLKAVAEKVREIKEKYPKVKGILWSPLNVIGIIVPRNLEIRTLEKEFSCRLVHVLGWF